jgi:hypothetical protein
MTRPATAVFLSAAVLWFAVPETLLRLARSDRPSDSKEVVMIKRHKTSNIQKSGVGFLDLFAKSRTLNTVKPA